MGAQIQASLATGEGIVSLQVNFCDSEGLELRGVHEKHGAVTVTDCLGAALDAVEVAVRCRKGRNGGKAGTKGRSSSSLPRMAPRGGSCGM